MKRTPDRPVVGASADAARGTTAVEANPTTHFDGGHTLSWALGIVADAPKHQDPTIVQACDIILRDSSDHCDRVTATELRKVLT